MDTDVSDLLILPDEILLEIFKYLLNGHALYSFYGLNERLNTCLTGYCRHIALTDVTINQFHHLCRSVLPELGSQIRSISLNNCRSVLQGKLFRQYYSDHMATVFPCLEKFIFTCFTADELNFFLPKFPQLDTLRHIEIYDLLTDPSNLFQSLVESNGQRLHSIIFKTSSSDLPSSPCLNLRHLTISIPTLDKLSPLLACIPHIHQCNVTIDEISMITASFDHLDPLVHLQQLFLRCFNHFWVLEELESLFHKLPALVRASLQISSQDTRFVDTDQKLLKLLPETVCHWNFSLRYFYDTIEEIDQHALSTSRFPMLCLLDEGLQQAILHTVPYRFPLLSVSPTMAKQMPTHDTYRNVHLFYDYHGMSLADSLPVLARCRRIQEVSIQSYESSEETVPRTYARTCRRQTL